MTVKGNITVCIQVCIQVFIGSTYVFKVLYTVLYVLYRFVYILYSLSPGSLDFEFKILLEPPKPKTSNYYPPTPKS